MTTFSALFSMFEVEDKPENTMLIPGMTQTEITKTIAALCTAHFGWVAK